MLTFLERSAGNVLAVKVTDKLTHADCARLLPRLEQLIAEHGNVRVLFDLEECDGWELGAAWDELKFSLAHGGQVERCAVVGGRRWQEVMTKLARPLFKGKYFDKAEQEQAWQWVLEGADSPARV
jgi:hypothetical protein